MADGGTARGPVDRALQDLTDDTRALDAAADRRRQQSLRRQAAASGTWRGTLVDLAERGVLVACSTGPGRSLRGRIGTIGLDFVGLTAPNGQRVLVALAAVGSVRPEPGTGTTIGDRRVTQDRTLAAALADLADEDRAVIVHTIAGDAVSGTLRTVGVDVVSVRPAGAAEVYVALATVTDVTVT